MALSRRRVLAGLGAGGVATGILHADHHLEDGRSGAAPVFAPAGRDPDELAGDERFWTTVARQYPTTTARRHPARPQFVNLENGYYGIMPAPVREEYVRNMDRLNQSNSYLLRTTYKAELEVIRARLAAASGVSTAEIALTRGGTEALQNLIVGYNRLRPGDAVMYADLDYHSCQYAMNSLRQRRGVDVVRISIAQPPTRQAVLDTYSRALRDHPQVRLLLLSHMNNRTGLVMPVREIVAMARARQVDVIADAAHSWGQLDFTIPDLGAEFVGFSLHKWINAPLGTGFLHIGADRLADIDTAFADETYPDGDIRSRVHSGTLDAAAFLTLPRAMDCHEALGAAVKQSRLRYLRNRWVEQVRQIDNVEILTPDDPAMHGAITSFRLAGRTSQADNDAIVGYLLDTHRIFTVSRGGVAGGDCVRVTPAQFTHVDHVDRLAAALHDVARRFRV